MRYTPDIAGCNYDGSGIVRPGTGDKNPQGNGKDNGARGGDYYIAMAPYLPVVEPVSILPMSGGDFAVLLNRVKGESFADDQLNILQTAARGNYFLVEQVCQILDLVSFEDDRLEAVRILYPGVLDVENSFKLYSKFEFSDSKEELREILE